MDKICVDCKHAKFIGAPWFEQTCRQEAASALRNPVYGWWPKCESQRAVGGQCGPAGTLFEKKVPPPPAFEHLNIPSGWAFWKGLFTR